MHVWRRQTGVIIGGREELLHQPLTLLLLRNMVARETITVKKYNVQRVQTG